MLTDYISELEKKKIKRCITSLIRSASNISSEMKTTFPPSFIDWNTWYVTFLSKKTKKKQVDLCYMFCWVVYPNVLSDDQTPKMCNRGSGAFQSVACRYNSQERVREWRWTKPNTNQTLKHDLVGSCAASQHPKTTRYFCFHCFVWE